MLAFVARRLAYFVPTLLAVAVLVFVTMNLLPGSAASMRGDERSAIDPAAQRRIEQELGLDKPLPLRFGIFLKRLAVGDLGKSFMNARPVTSLLGDRIWPSLKLALVAIVIAVAIGVPLGFMSARYQGTVLDTGGIVAAICGVSMPQFLLGLLLMYLLSVRLNWFPTMGYGEHPKYIVLPALTLGVGYAALLARTTRASVIEILRSDFIRTARAKGLREGMISLRHVLPNSSVLILTTVGLQFGTLMGQAVVVEKLFSWPGVGSLLVDSIFTRDLPVTQGCILFLTCLFMLVNLAIDLLYSVIDPRIKQ